MADVKHTLRKIGSTVRMAVLTSLARHFGTYRHSVSGYDWGSFAIYEWRGRRWYVPTEPALAHGEQPDG